MPDFDPIAVLRQLPEGTTAEQAANLLSAIRESGAKPTGEPEQPLAPMTPEQARQAEAQALLETLQQQTQGAWISTPLLEG